MIASRRLERRGADPSTPWLRWPDWKGPADLRLFCFPYAGGGASAYLPWQRSLPEGVVVCGVQPPGREERADEAPFDRLGPLVETAAREMAPFLDGTFALFGHSLGALVAFELARHLRRTGGPRPVALFVSGRWAPQLPAPTPPIHALAEDDLWEGVRSYGGVPAELDSEPELRGLLTPLVRADFAISETHVHREGPRLDHPVVALGGERDPRVRAADLLPWREQTTGRFSLRTFPGGHFFIHSDRLLVLRELLAELGYRSTASGIVTTGSASRTEERS